MAKAYLVAQIDVTDPERYPEYVQQVSATTAPFGGRYLVRAGQVVPLEGKPPRSRIVVIEFPSMEQARAWYDSDAYAPVKPLRLAASEGDAFLVEGVD